MKCLNSFRVLEVLTFSSRLFQTLGPRYLIDLRLYVVVLDLGNVKISDPLRLYWETRNLNRSLTYCSAKLFNDLKNSMAISWILRQWSVVFLLSLTNIHNRWTYLETHSLMLFHLIFRFCQNRFLNKNAK
jgi:hypothetical protein